MSRPITPHPVNPARPRPLPGPSQPPRPTTPPPSPTRPGRIVPILGLIAALAAIAVLADVCVMAAAWATTRNVYYVPDSNDWVYALVIVGFALWTGVSVILAPPRRKRRPPVRMVRAAVSRGRGRSSTSGPATVPVSGWPGAVAPLARPSTTSPVGGRAGTTPSPSPSWRTAA